MSYSADLKKFLNDIKNTRTCCKRAYSDGFDAMPLICECERDAGAYLRGSFVSYGTLSDPKKGYYLAFAPPADKLSSVFNAFETAGFSPGVVANKGRTLLYFKNSAQIEDFLTLAGGPRFTLEYISIKVTKQLRADANRLMNAETANQDRASTAAATQLHAIKLLLKHREFKSLPASLLETARLRLEYPELDLASLAKKHKNGMSKSGLNHRLGKIVELASKYM